MTDWIWESHLPTRLGLNRDELRKLRQTLLIDGVDFKFKKNRVSISTTGLEKIHAHLKLPADAPTPAIQSETSKKTPPVEKQKNAAPRDDGEHGEAPLMLCVWRTFPKNRHIIEAYKQGTDPAKRENIVTLKVKDATRFTRMDNTGKPMTVQARHLNANFYEMIGPMPKHRGRF